MNGFTVLNQPLTVKNLKEALQDLPQDAIVKSSSGEGKEEKTLCLFGIIYNDKEVVIQTECIGDGK